MQNRIFALSIMMVLSAMPISAQMTVFYAGRIISPMDSNSRPLPRGWISIGPSEQFPSNLGTKDSGQLTLFYADNTIENFQCMLEVDESDRIQVLDNANHFIKVKGVEASFWALVPNYKPARGYRLMRGNIVIYEKYFQSEPAPIPEIKEELTDEGVKLWWKEPSYVRCSLDNGKTWEIRAGKNPEHNKVLDHWLVISNSELEKKPIIEFWLSKNLVVTRYQYRIGSEKPVVVPF